MERKVEKLRYFSTFRHFLGQKVKTEIYSLNLAVYKGMVVRICFPTRICKVAKSSEKVLI